MSHFAPAKINLALHVTGRRSDGYHLLSSLVVFANLGDDVTLAPADRMSLHVTGPMASGVPEDDRNLAWRAARLGATTAAFAITLHKRLPNGAGLGGGSANAAAVLRGLVHDHGYKLPSVAQLASLGADVPVCVVGHPSLVEGVGEQVTPLGPLPPLWIVLVSPGVQLDTAAVFKALTSHQGSPLAPIPAAGWASGAELAAWLSNARNDLEPAALTLAPQIGVCLDLLAKTPGVALARMSGSGSTCFGLCLTQAAAEAAVATLHDAYPDWWTRAAEVRRQAD